MKWILFFLFFGPAAQADQSAYKNFLIGERAGGMGGAFSAIADDPSGIYHNPAGLAFSEADYFSLSTNAFQSSSVRYEGVFGATRDYNLSAGALTPSFFGFTQALGPGRFAFAVVVEEFQLTNQNDRITDISTTAGALKNYSRQLTREEAVYLVGPAYSMPFGKKFSLGLSLFFSYHREKGTTQETVEFNAGNPADYFLNMGYVMREDFGLKPKLGVVWTPLPIWSVAFTFTKHIHIYGGGAFEQRSAPQKDTAGALIAPNGSFAHDVTSSSISNVFSRRVAPFEFTLGNALFLSDTFLMSGDFTLYTPDPDYIESTVVTTWNAALGFEWYLFPKIPVRWGLYTNNANTPATAEGGINQGTSVNMYGGTVGFSFMGPQSSITVTGGYAYGKGEGQIVTNSTAIQDATQQAFTFYLSASYQL